jgi:hypothetical protein
MPWHWGLFFSNLLHTAARKVSKSTKSAREPSKKKQKQKNPDS